MKWSRAIQSDEKRPKNYSPAQRLETDKTKNSNSSNCDLVLQSCEKAKRQPNLFPVSKRTLPFETVHKQPNNCTSEFVNLNKESSKLQSTLVKLYKESNKNKIVSQEVTNLITNFVKELEMLMSSYMKKFQSFQLQLECRQSYAIKIANYVEEIIDKSLESLQESKINLPLRDHNASDSEEERTSHKHSSGIIEKINFIQKNRDKSVRSRDSGQKNFAKIEQTFNEVNKLLQKAALQPRFVRTSRITTKRDRHNDSSVQQLMEKSVEDRLRSSHSKHKTNQALYNLNKILNQ